MRQLVEELVKRLDEVEQRRIRLENAAKDADAAVTSAERRLRQALGGLSLGRWRALVSGQASIRSASDGRDAGVAARRRFAVEAALQELAASRRESEDRVAEASSALRQAAKGVTAVAMPAARGTSIGEPVDATADHQIALRAPKPSKEILVMSTRSNVKAYQRRIVELDAEHTRAQDRLVAAIRKKDEVLAAQDRQVQEAERELGRSYVRWF